MHAWDKGHAFLNLVKHHQEKKRCEKVKVEHRLKEITQTIVSCQQEHKAISQQINRAILPGVISRQAIYQCIRRQGVLLARQQDITQQLIDLQKLQLEEEQRLKQCRNDLNQLDKKQHKTDFYLQKIRRELLLKADIGTENEIQEIVGYGGKNNDVIGNRALES